MSSNSHTKRSYLFFSVSGTLIDVECLFNTSILSSNLFNFTFFVATLANSETPVKKPGFKFQKLKKVLKKSIL